MRWTVFCDFDHTITLEDVTDQLLETFAEPQWREVEALWEQGLIGSRVCMQSQIKLIRASRAQIDAAVDSIEIDQSFKDFAKFCKENDWPLIVISDGLDYVITRILERNGIRDLRVIAGHLKQVGPDRWELETPNADAGCSSQAATCKCASSRQIRGLTGGDRMLYIGDGRSDYCVSAEEADFIFAKTSLLSYCKQQQLPHLPFDDFSQAITLAIRLIDYPAQPLYVQQESSYA